MALLRLATVDVDRFVVPLIRPIKVGDVVLHSREGFIVALADEAGRTGLGEVAPLPGLDRTDLKSCRDELAAAKSMIVAARFNTDAFDMAAPWLGMATLPPSLAPHALFGIESALFGLYLQSEGTADKTRAPRLPDPLKIRVNGLFIPDSKEEAAAQIRTLQARGIQTIKVKIGRLPAEEEIRQILSLADGIGKGLTLRLDGNRTLSARSYSRYYSALRHMSVEYAEEPLSDGERLSSQDVPWPRALDESLPLYLHSGNPGLAGLPSEVRTIILKPGLLSGLHGMARCIAEANNLGIKTVLSSAFNTGVALATLGAFSVLAALPTDTVHGFDTLRHLKSDLLSDSPPIQDGVLIIPRRLLSEKMDLNRNLLTKEEL